MNQDYFSFKVGNVEYWGLDCVEPQAPVGDQLDELKEDLAQVSYGPNVLLDIGWYSSDEDDGNFRVMVILDQDWGAPIFSEACSSWRQLKDAVGRAVSAAVAKM